MTPEKNVDPRLRLLILATERKRRIALWLCGTAIGLLSMALLFKLSIESYTAPVACADGGRMTLSYQVNAYGQDAPLVATAERIPSGGWDASTRRQGGLTAAARAGDVLVQFDHSEATWIEGGQRVESRFLGDFSVEAAAVPETDAPRPIWAVGVRQHKDLRVYRVDPTSRIVEPVGLPLPIAGDITQVRAASQTAGLLVSWREMTDGVPGDELNVARFDGTSWEKLPGFTSPDLAAYALAGRGAEAWWFGITPDYKKDGQIVGTYSRRDADGWKAPIEVRMKSPTWLGGGINGMCLAPDGEGVRLFLGRFGVVNDILLPFAPTGPVQLGLLSECADLPFDERARVWLWAGALLAIALGLTTVGAAMLWERMKARQALELAIVERIRHKRQNALRRRSVREVANDIEGASVPLDSIQSLALAAMPAVTYAALWQRALAFAIDGVLLLPACVSLMMYWGLDLKSPPEFDDPRVQMAWASIQGVVLVYFVVSEWIWGQSFGKYALGIKVVRLNGGRVGLGGAIARNVLRMIEMTPWFLLLGAASVMVTRRSQRIGDLAAGTIVIRRPPAPEEPVEDEV